MKLLALTINGNTIIVPNSVPQPGTAGKIIGNGIFLFLTAGIIIALIFVVWSGIQWINSTGDKQKVAAARGRLTFAIVGIIIMFAAFLIISFFGYIFGVQLIN